MVVTRTCLRNARKLFLLSAIERWQVRSAAAGRGVKIEWLATRLMSESDHD
jgi:hypothetical protein